MGNNARSCNFFDFVCFRGYMKEPKTFVILFISLFSCACLTKEAPALKTATPPQVPSPATAAPSVKTEIYHGTGRVIGTNPNFPSVEMDHDEIVGLMPAMRMEFFVKDKWMLKELRSGDKIQFTLENGVGGLKITEIKKL